MDTDTSTEMIFAGRKLQGQADHSIEDQSDGVFRLLLKAIHPLAHGLVLQHLGLQPHLLFQNDLLKLCGGDGLNAAMTNVTLL